MDAAVPPADSDLAALRKHLYLLPGFDLMPHSARPENSDSAAAVPPEDNFRKASDSAQPYPALAYSDPVLDRVLLYSDSALHAASVHSGPGWHSALQHFGLPSGTDSTLAYSDTFDSEHLPNLGPSDSGISDSGLLPDLDSFGSALRSDLDS